MAGFGGMAEMAVVAGLGIAGLFVLHAVLAGGSRVGEPEMPFVSGWEPAAHALSRYHVRWYPLTLLFLAFDVEMLFMYPWAVVVGRVGWRVRSSRCSSSSAVLLVGGAVGVA